MREITRRHMLRLLGTAGAAIAAAPVFSASNPETKTRLGICSISFALRWPTVNRGQGTLEETLEFIDHCRALGAGGVQTSIRPQLEFTSGVRSKIESFGLYLEGQLPMPRADSELDRFEIQVRAAKEAGATVLRTACLGSRRYETFKDAPAFAEFAQHAEESITRAEPIVRKHRMRLAIENHKDWRVPELLGIVQRLSSEYIGVCLDTGNSIALLEDPMAVVEALAPYAFSTHLKDMAVQEYEQGFLLAEVPLGDGFLDLPKIVDALRRARPELHFNLEMITRDALRVPCLTPPYWASSPELPGAFLASTLALVRAHALKARMPEVSGLRAERQLQAEEMAVRRSLAYARERLDL